MPDYRAYPTVKDTPSRKQRKAQRKRIFWENKIKAREERKERRLKRKETTDAAQ